eukprot:Sdes_comp15360_c0_seq2m4236
MNFFPKLIDLKNISKFCTSFASIFSPINPNYRPSFVCMRRMTGLKEDERSGNEKSCLEENRATTNVGKSSELVLPPKREESYAQNSFRIHVNNLPKISLDELKKFLNFSSEEEKQNGMKILDRLVWKNKTLTVGHAEVLQDPYLKRKQEEMDPEKTASFSHPAKKSQPPNDSPPLSEIDLCERLNNVCTPLWKMPYSDQLLVKGKAIRDVLSTFQTSLLRLFSASGTSTCTLGKNSPDPATGLLFPLEAVKPSPTTTQYRNKCDFTIGFSPNEEATVGFTLGLYREGIVHVAGPKECVHVTSETLRFCEMLERYVRASKLGVFNRYTLEGYWRGVTVRDSTGTDDLMAIVQMHPQEMSEAEIARERHQLTEYFQKCIQQDGLKLTGLIFQVSDKKSVGITCPEKMEICIGDGFMHEKLCGLDFRISPTSFFQVNTLGAEVLYETVKKWCHQVQDAHIVDICCGTGTIGLVLSSCASLITGIELSKEAVADAIFNAERNGLGSKTRFVAGKR